MTALLLQTRFERRRAAMLAALAAAVVCALTVRAQDPTLRYGGQIPPEVDTIYQRGLAWLANAQDSSGSWKGGNEGLRGGWHLRDGVPGQRRRS